jgi:hypothetical protein
VCPHTCINEFGLYWGVSISCTPYESDSSKSTSYAKGDPRQPRWQLDDHPYICFTSMKGKHLLKRAFVISTCSL